MGLSGAAKKQRIQDDPRNLRWAQDTSAPGFKLLASMGWDPSSNPSLGNTESQAAIFANGGSAFSKKISSIPIAKEDNLGIGMKRGSAASVVGTLKAMGVPGGGIGAGAAKVSGFVTAGSGSSTPNGGGQGSSQGGEFGGLLARLNKMKEQGSLVATPIPSDTDSSKKRKRSGSQSSSSSSSGSDSSDSDDEDEPKIIVETTTISQPVPESAPISSYAAMLLKNPRMAARSKHLRAKRMATSENASAMAEILGLAPTPSPSSSGASTPNPHITPALAIAPPSKEGWPVAPPRGTSAMVSTTTISSTSGTGAPPPPMFTSAKTTTLAPTFDPSPSTSTSTSTSLEESDKARRKREKAEKKLAKEAKKLAKEEKRSKRLPSPPVVVRPPRSPSPEFKVHSAAHDPFHVTSETPVGDREPPKKAAGVYASMFVSSKQGGMGATWDGDAGKLKEAEGDAKVEVTEPVKEKKSKKDKSKKKRKAEEIESVAVEPVVEAVEAVTEERKETKEEKRARKEAKRARKEAKGKRNE